MISMKDIYYTIDSNLVKMDFSELDLTDKKEAVDRELKKYLIFKINQLNYKINYATENLDQINALDLLKQLEQELPTEVDRVCLSDIIHYVLQIATFIQGYKVTWWTEEAEDLIKYPIIEFDEYNRWDTLKTHLQTNYVDLFEFVYGFFCNEFVNNKKRIKPLKNKILKGAK